MNAIDKFRDVVKEKLSRNPILAWREEIDSQEVERLRQLHAPDSRDRLWHMEVMLWMWLTAGLWRERSFNAVTAELWVPLCAEIPELAGKTVNSGRMTEGRGRVPVGMLREVRQKLAEKGDQERGDIGQWKGRRVLWLDGSTFSMPDEPELREHFGAPTNQHGEAPFPVGRIVNLGVAASRMLIGSAQGPYETSEHELARRIVGEVQAGDVVVDDRNFASAEWLALVKLRGADVMTRRHSRLKIKLHKRRKVGPKDWVLTLEVPEEARRRSPELPETIEVRLFHVLVGHGKRKRKLWFQTTLLDPVLYPKMELALLYFERWGVETSYAEIKVELHLDILRSKTVEGVEREIEARLAAYNYIRLQMLRAAKQAGLDPRELSFVEAVRTIVRFGQLLRGCTSPGHRKDLLETMLKQIAAHRVPSRPGRHEPRAVKRPPKPFPRLKKSREDWRKQNGLAA